MKNPVLINTKSKHSSFVAENQSDSKFLYFLMENENFSIVFCEKLISGKNRIQITRKEENLAATF